MRRRRGFTVIEVVTGIALGLMLWAILATLARDEARMRQKIDSRIAQEHVPAVLYRHLSRDVSRASLSEGRAPVRVSDEGRSLEILVQSAPSRVEGNRLEIPVRPVTYRFLGAGKGAVREESGRRQPLGVTGLTSLTFAYDSTSGKDTLRVCGATRTDMLSRAEEFSLSFSVGVRRAGPVRWVSLLKPQLTE